MSESDPPEPSLLSFIGQNELSLITALGEKVEHASDLLADRLNSQLGQFNDQTRMFHLGLVARDPDLDIITSSEYTNPTDLLNWAALIKRLTQQQRRTTNELFRKLTIFEELKQKNILLDPLDIDTLGEWRMTESNLLIDAGFHEQVVRFYKKAIRIRSYS